MQLLNESRAPRAGASAPETRRGNFGTTQHVLLRLPDVLIMTGLKKSTLFSLIQKGLFPSQVRLGTRSVAWRSEDIAAWIAARPPVRCATPIGGVQ